MSSASVCFELSRSGGGLDEVDPYVDKCLCNRGGEWRRVFLQAGDLEEWHALAISYDA
jgi:hypothetical protein